MNFPFFWCVGLNVIDILYVLLYKLMLEYESEEKQINTSGNSNSIRRNFMIAYAILGFAMGIFLLIVVYKGYIEDIIDTRFRKEVVEIEGEVVNFAKVRNFRMTSDLICPVISFSYNGGGKQEIPALGNARTINRYYLNQKVLICYNPNPMLLEKRIVVKRDYKDIWTAINFLLLAFWFLGIGIAASYYGIKNDMFI